MDTHEFTESDWQSAHNGDALTHLWLGDGLTLRGPSFAVPVNFDEAMYSAELAGKRLPTASEYDAAQALVLHQYQQLPATDSQPAAIGPVGASWDATSTQPPIVGLLSNVAEWTSSRSKLHPNTAGTGLAAVPNDHRIVVGGDWDVIRTGLESTTAPGPAVPDVPRLTVQPGLGFRCVRSAAPRFLSDAD